MNDVWKYTQFVMPISMPHKAIPIMIRHTKTSRILQTRKVQSVKRVWLFFLCVLALPKFSVDVMQHVQVWGHSLWPEQDSGETQFFETSSEIHWRSIMTGPVPTRPLVTSTDCFLLCRPLSGVWQWAPGQHLTINQRAQPLLIACRFFPCITHKQ